MSFSKLTPAEINSRGATTLPNQPTISAANLKREFDAPAKEVVAPAFNKLIDDLEDTASAASLGATAPSPRTGTTVQGVLNSISSDLATLEGSVAQVIADDHTHPNKALLDTYTQTETDLADAVSKKHAHSNLALLETYTQTNSDIADAVSKKHSHSNKSLLDSYTQSDSDIADAVSKKHSHSNKGVLDDLSDSGSGTLQYKGSPISGTVKDAYKEIDVTSGGSTTNIVASAEDKVTFKAGANVTLAANSTTKEITISSTGGGGGGGGDMYEADYDNLGTVKSAGGIDSYVTTEIGKLDVSDSAVSGQYVSAVSETDGKVSVTRASLPTVDQTYSSSSTNAQSGTAVAGALATLSIPADLDDLSDVTISTPSNDQVLKYNGTTSKWENAAAPTTGHNMIANTPEITLLTSISTAPTSDNNVVSAYGIKKWSNADVITLWTTVPQGDDTVGQWDDDWTTAPVDRTGWIWHECLYHLLSDNDVEMQIVFDPKESEIVSVYAWRYDDDYQNGGVNGGCVAIKLNSAVQSASGVKVGIKLKRQRTQTINVTPLT